MISFVSGDFFDYDADIMVNTVNCVGVMGAGVALAFKSRFPEMFADYVEKCRAHAIRPGIPSVWVQKDMISKEMEIVNFPTKDHWRDPSEYSYIEDGLRWLSDYLDKKDGKIVTLPALGCGHGGLEWGRVRSMIFESLEHSPANIYVFEPADSIKSAQSKNKKIDYESLLLTVGAGVIKSTSSSYPENLLRYTEKDIYFFPIDHSFFDYDFSLICSTKPMEREAQAIRNFVELCALHGKSILFGASAFEKKLAVEFAEKGLPCACVLPSGLYESAKKISSKVRSKKPNLISTGNPTISFDKKEFIPSVLTRIHLSERVMFFSDRIAWVRKFKNYFSSESIKVYYFDSMDSSSEDEIAAAEIGAVKFNSDISEDFFLSLGVSRA